MTSKLPAPQPMSLPCTNDQGRGGNGLLAVLSEQAFALIKPHLRYREVHKGTTLWGADSPAEQIYFPQEGLISITLPCQQGHRIEVGSVGREGAAGIHASSWPAQTPTSAVMRIGGQVATIAEGAFRAATRQNDEIAMLAGSSIDWILRQGQLMAACNATHGAEARLCRWLLLAGARAGSAMIPVTQEEMAGMLGIRRTTVTLLAKGLQDARVIGYSRGKLVIRDREALKAAACACRAALGEEHWPSTRLRHAHGGGAGAAPAKDLAAMDPMG